MWLALVLDPLYLLPFWFLVCCFCYLSFEFAKRIALGLVHIGRTALLELGHRHLYRVSREMGVKGSRLHLPVAEELPSHRQALT